MYFTFEQHHVGNLFHLLNIMAYFKAPKILVGNRKNFHLHNNFKTRRNISFVGIKYPSKIFSLLIGEEPACKTGREEATNTRILLPTSALKRLFIGWKQQQSNVFITYVIEIQRGFILHKWINIILQQILQRKPILYLPIKQTK